MQRSHRVAPGIIIAVAFAVFGQQACGQNTDHAPALQQCEADYRLWYAQAMIHSSDPAKVREALRPLGAGQLLDQAQEMVNCGMPYPDGASGVGFVGFDVLSTQYGDEVGTRYFNCVPQTDRKVLSRR